MRCVCCAASKTLTVATVTDRYQGASVREKKKVTESHKMAHYLQIGSEPNWWMLFKLLTLWVVGCRAAVICQKTLELMAVGVTTTTKTRPDQSRPIRFGFSFPPNRTVFLKETALKTGFVYWALRAKNRWKKSQWGELGYKLTSLKSAEWFGVCLWQ